MSKIIVNVNRKNKEPSKKYPYIGISRNGNIVIFTSPQKGPVLQGRYDKIGEVSNDWDESMFTPFIGTIEIGVIE